MSVGAIIPAVAAIGGVAAAVGTGGAAAIPLALGAVGAATSAYGALEQGQATQKASAYQAQVDRNNATIANQKAQYASEAGAQKQQQEQLQQRQLQGRIGAAQAANGVDVDSGSAVDVQNTARETGLTDIQQTGQNALLQNYGYRTQSSSATASAQLEGMQGSQAVTGSQIGAFGSIASSAGSLGSQWSKMQQTGVGSGSSSNGTTINNSGWSNAAG